MEQDYTFLLKLAIVLAVAHGAGFISVRLKQPAVLGQIVAGILLGIGVFEKTELIENFGQIGVILLMFVAGLETDVEELTRSIKSSSLIAIGGVIAPAAMVFIVVMAVFPMHSISSAIFLGVVTTATSVSISVQTLREIDRLKTRQGVMIMGAAIIDDVIGIILLTVLVGIVRPGMGSSVQTVLIDVVALFAIITLTGFILLKAMKFYEKKHEVGELVSIFGIIVCFVLSYISESLGVAAITGAYFTGVIFSMTAYKHNVSHQMNRFSNLLFTPVFFVSIGMDIDVVAAVNAIGVGSILIVLGSVGKIIGCGLGAKVSGFNGVESLQIGIGMIPRAEVAIIVANLGLRMTILSEADMAATVLMVLVTTLITPTLLKWSFNREMLIRE